MNRVSIRDLQRLSGADCGEVGRPDRWLLVPLKAADPDRLAAVLAHAEALAKGRNPAADDAALAPFGEVDPVDWSVEAVRALRAEQWNGAI